MHASRLNDPSWDLSNFLKRAHSFYILTAACFLQQAEHRQAEDASSADEQAAAAAAAAVAAAVAESVAGSPRGSACTTPPPRTPYASSGGATPSRDAQVGSLGSGVWGLGLISRGMFLPLRSCL
jgi:hypothetical protein